MEEKQAMDERRQLLQTAAAGTMYSMLAALGLVAARPAAAQSLSAAAWQTKSVSETLKAMGVSAPADSHDVVINAPEIAENGAVVPVGVRSSIAGTDFIAVLVEKNPNTLAAAYEIMPGTEADVNMRIKMGQTSEVLALVRAEGRFYMVRKEIKVTLGGCGG
jgi:sulfur-oxidizing protein SoxY